MSTLRSRADFARIETMGSTRADRLLVVRYVPNDLGHERFAISTGRRLGGAVQRNRVRRRIRETLRQIAPHDGPGRDILIVARPASASASFAELRAALERHLHAVRTGSVRGAS